LTEAYNYIDLLEREMVDLEKEVAELKGASGTLWEEMVDLENEVVELKGASDTLWEKLKIAREEVRNSPTRMENLKNSSQAF
jgi:predicted  nucleic acid-binding Zn-ribbon protein